MTQFLAALFLAFVIFALAALLERSHRRTAGLPRLASGADHFAGGDRDPWQVRYARDGGRPLPRSVAHRR